MLKSNCDKNNLSANIEIIITIFPIEKIELRNKINSGRWIKK